MAERFVFNTVVTGGAGFIGSHLVEYLRRQGRRVLVIDDLSTGRLENIASLLGEDCRLIRGRVGQVLRENPGLLEGVQEVYHLAASVGVELVLKDPAGMIRNNVQETAAVLEAAAAAGAAVLVASSSEVYGRNAWMPLREDQELVFGPTTNSRWSYGMAKALGEHLGLALYRSCGLKVVIVRLFNTIGPRQVGQYGMVVPRFIRWAVSNQPIRIYGDGRQTRSFCDVRDVVRALVELLGDPRHYGQIFNVGSDQEISIEQLADRIIALSGSRSVKQFVPYQQAFDRDFDDPQRRVPDISRLRRAIGFVPRYSLDQTLKELIDLARAGEGASVGSSVSPVREVGR